MTSLRQRKTTITASLLVTLLPITVNNAEPAEAAHPRPSSKSRGEERTESTKRGWLHIRRTHRTVQGPPLDHAGTPRPASAFGAERKSVGTQTGEGQGIAERYPAHPPTRDFATQTDPPNTWWNKVKRFFQRRWQRLFTRRGKTRVVTESTAAPGEFEATFPTLQDFRTNEEIREVWNHLQLSRGWRVMNRGPRTDVPVAQIIDELIEDGHDAFGKGTAILTNNGMVLRDRHGKPRVEEFTAVNRNGKVYFLNLHLRSGLARPEQYRYGQVIEYTDYHPVGQL